MNTGRITDPPVKIRRDILQQIEGLAEKQHLRTELLINRILEQYLQHAQQSPQPSQDAAFLLSMAGMFASEEPATSEQVHEIVSAYVDTKYATQGHSR